MRVIVLDFETYWTTTHSLKKMSALNYVMHPDTEVISCSIKIGGGPARCVFGEAKLKKLFGLMDWSDVLLVAHNNSEFDALIAAFRFGIKPKMWGCTLAMARPIYAKTIGLSLAALGVELCPELGVKGSLEATNTKGKHLCDFTADELASVEVYNNQDTDICHGVFTKLMPRTPASEMRLIDATIRMLVEPAFELDAPLLEQTLVAERENKHRMLLDMATMLGMYHPGMTSDDAATAVGKVLSSAAKFAKLLESLGVDCPMKPSPKVPGKMIPALAKTDEDFMDLQDHDNPVVAMAARARLGVKSTQLETRIVKFLQAAALFGGLLPIPLRYCGAETTMRWSGWAYNPQNLPRILPGAPKLSDALRYSLRAPKGYKVVVADLSGIELRINMFLWKVPYAMALFTADPAKADLYKAQASDVFHIPVDQIEKPQRQAGKAMHLGCGFGLRNPRKYRAVAKSMAQIDVPLNEADKHIDGYRRKHPEVVRGWKTCHTALEYIYAKEEFVIDPWGLCRTSAEGIVTPVGTIRYPNLRIVKNEEGRDEWVYGKGRSRARIYAGKVTENIVQHLARGVVADNMLEVKRLTGHYPRLTVHDELVYVVPEAEAAPLLAAVHQAMRTPPKWWTALPTWSEGDIADTYGAAK
jgi:DNA polymerase